MLIFLCHLEKDGSAVMLLRVQYKAQFGQCKTQVCIKLAGWMNLVSVENQLVKMCFLQIAGKSQSIYLKNGRSRQRTQEGKSFPGS